MVICSFFLSGTCRFGKDCQNEHPAPAYTLESMKLDLTTERPSWALSSYAPGKGNPNLIAGMDESPEELRLRYYTARASNDQSLYPEAALVNKVETEVQKILSNLNSAYQFSLSQVNHESATAPAIVQPARASGFGTTPSAFSNVGQNSTFGAFGASKAAGSAFGSGGQLGTSAFGGGGAFGKPATSAFGTSGFGSATPSAFGAPAFGHPATTSSAFGTSSFGQPPSGFGSAVPATSGFGAFGGSKGVSAFGSGGVIGAVPASSAFAPAKPVATGGFGAFGSSNLGPNTSSAFGAPAFGQPSTSVPSPFGQTATTPSAFGNSSFGQPPSGFGSAVLATSGFGAFGGSKGVSAFGSGGVIGVAPASTTNNPFGSTAPVTTSAFGGGGAFGAPSTFGTPQLAAVPTPPTPFGSQNAFSAFSQPAKPSAFGAPTTAFGTSAFSGGFAAPVIAQSSKILDPFSEFATIEDQFTALDLSAFKAERFSWDSIPLLPPPLSLRN